MSGSEQARAAALTLALAAERLTGTPFRLHGRDPACGLDCVGLIHAALLACGHPGLPPFAYALHNRSVAAGLDALRAAGMRPTEGSLYPGMVVLARPAPTQAHLLIAVRDNRFVHAHAGLRRVVATPAPLPWALARQWCPGAALLRN